MKDKLWSKHSKIVLFHKLNILINTSWEMNKEFFKLNHKNLSMNLFKTRQSLSIERGKKRKEEDLRKSKNLKFKWKIVSK